MHLEPVTSVETQTQDFTVCAFQRAQKYLARVSKTVGLIERDKTDFYFCDIVLTMLSFFFFSNICV
jgi:hypothetical protein